MDDDQQFCLRWNNHQSTLISVFDTLLENGTLVDCTLAAEGKFLKAHKVVLSACSPYFAALLSQQYDKHPIFILKDVKFQELRAMMDYMYRGEVNISQDQLAALLKAAESLQIKGLSDNRGSSSTASSQQKQPQIETVTKSLPPTVPASKATGLTIENKRPLKTDMLDSDISGSRENSASPTSRKRKKLRRRSVDTNLMDNHDQHSNSSSHSMHTTSQTQALTLTSPSVVACVPATNNAATSMLSSITSSNSSIVLATNAAVAAAAAIKKTDSVQQQHVAETLKLQLVKHQTQQQTESQQSQRIEGDECSGAEQGDAHDGEQESDEETDESHIKVSTQEGTDNQEKSINQSELMIEPKNEYDDVQDENVEDLTLDEGELLDDLDQAGPSHGGEGSSQGYAQWQMEREQSEAFMATQDTVGGQHRDAQDDSSALGGGFTKIKLESIKFWSDPEYISIADQSMISSDGSPHPSSNYLPVWRKTHKSASRTTPGRIKIAAKKTSSTCAPVISFPCKSSLRTSIISLNSSNASVGSISSPPPNGNSTSAVRKEDQIAFQHENDTKPWKCKTCGRNYKWKNSLKCHIKNECGVPPKYTCERLCGYKTHIHSNLKRHLNSKFCKPN